MAVGQSSIQRIKKEASFWSARLFGSLVSGVGLISFIQHALGIHLIPAYAHGIEVYRLVAGTIIQWALSPFQFLLQLMFQGSFHWPKVSISAPYRDVATISIVSSLAYMRSAIRETLSSVPSRSEKMLLSLVGTMMAFVAGIAFIGIAILLVSLSSVVLTDDVTRFLDDGKEPPVGWLQARAVGIDSFYSILGILAACILFFITNAYLP